jgi:hypothetical protein
MTVALAGCVTSGDTTVDTTDTTVSTVSASPERTGPVDTRRAVASDTPGCPLLSATDAAQIGGMRLARIQTLKRGTSVIGCRFFAIQGSWLAQSEHLPGPDQPVIEIASTRYVSGLAAHNALARVSTKGSDQNQYNVTADVVGVAYRVAFDPADGPRDWAFGFSKGTTLVVVRTATNVTSQIARDIARAVYPKF